MKKVVCLLSIALFLITIICCDGAGVDNPVPSIGMKNFSNTGCKSTTRAAWSDDSYFELKATEGNMLYDAKVEMEGNSITIREYDLTDLDIMMSCQCPFDLGYEIGPLKNGESYSIKVVSGVALPVTNGVVFSIVYSPSFSEVIVPSRD